MEKIYTKLIENDTKNLLHEDSDYMIDELREQRQTKDVPFVNDEKNNLLNIVGGVDVVERENKNGECFKVVNFSVFSKYEESNNVYKTYSVY